MFWIRLRKQRHTNPKCLTWVSNFKKIESCNTILLPLLVKSTNDYFREVFALFVLNNFYNNYLVKLWKAISEGIGKSLKIFQKLTIIVYLTFILHLNLYALTPQNSQTHSNNSLALADELLECVWPFSGVGARGCLPEGHTNLNKPTAERA